MYLLTEITILPPGTKTGLFYFKNLMTEDMCNKIPLPQVKYHPGLVSNYQI